MGLLDVFKKNRKEKEIAKAPEKGAEKKAAQEPEKGKLLKSQKPAKSKAKRKEDTKQAYKVLISPLVTEKATATGTYLFAVDENTNRQEVKKAVEVVYGVRPLRVNIVNYGGRKVRWGKGRGRTKSWKKAIVYLKEGDKIDTFEGV